MKIVIIDGQGGRLGALVTEQLIKKGLKDSADNAVIAVGTNSIATAAMIKAGADAGATGENPVVVNCADADIIVCPIGAVIANSLLGEITPRMAEAVGASKAEKFLIPSGKCNNHVVGAKDLAMPEYVALAVDGVVDMINKMQS
jgi:hypothetical protein